MDRSMDFLRIRANGVAVLFFLLYFSIAGIAVAVGSALGALAVVYLIPSVPVLVQALVAFVFPAVTLGLALWMAR